MNKYLILVLFFLLSFAFISGHEGHKHTSQENVHSIHEEAEIQEFSGRPLTWMQWFGSLHFTFLHFPIALIAMTVFSELFFTWTRFPIFDFSSRFMLISAAIFSVPTSILGLIYSYTTTYSGLLEDFIWWHMWAGFTTAALAIMTAYVRERYGKDKFYYCSLTLLFLLMCFTGYLGGGLTFGPYNLYLPLEQ